MFLSKKNYSGRTMNKKKINLVSSIVLQVGKTETGQKPD